MEQLSLVKKRMWKWSQEKKQEKEEGNKRWRCFSSSFNRKWIKWVDSNWVVMNSLMLIFPILFLFSLHSVTNLKFFNYIFSFSRSCSLSYSLELWDEYSNSLEFSHSYLMLLFKWTLLHRLIFIFFLSFSL
jgi:hypothetical protein